MRASARGVARRRSWREGLDAIGEMREVLRTRRSSRLLWLFAGGVYAAILWSHAHGGPDESIRLKASVVAIPAGVALVVIWAWWPRLLPFATVAGGVLARHGVQTEGRCVGTFRTSATARPDLATLLWSESELVVLRSGQPDRILRIGRGSAGTRIRTNGGVVFVFLAPDAGTAARPVVGFHCRRLDAAIGQASNPTSLPQAGPSSPRGDEE